MSTTKISELTPEAADIVDELIVGKQPDWSRRVLFLDFDGPINLGGHYEPPEDEERHIVHTWRGIPHTGEWKDFVCRTLHLSYYQEVADLFRDLNCVWISTWKDLTQSKLNPLLDYDFGYVDWKYRGPSDWGMHGKSSAIATLVKATGCDWLIVDDELEQFHDIIEHESGKAGELIAPNSWTGTSLDEMEEIVHLMTEYVHTLREPAKFEFPQQHIK